MSAAALDLRAASLPGRVEALSLRLAPGERVAIVGRNGAGKSSLLRLAAGLEAPTTGEVRRRGRVGWVPQACRDALLPWKTARENVALGAHGDAWLGRALEAVTLDAPVLDARPGRLSGGQAQRVVIARALGGAPSLLLLDEPFSALDAAARVTLRSSLAAHCDRYDVAAVLVTHALSDARAFAHRAVVIDGPPARVAGEVPTDAAAFEASVRRLLGWAA